MNQIHVQYDADSGKWKGTKDGSQRASVVGDTQKEVAGRSREIARNQGLEVTIHRKDDNRIRGKDSYGNDPRSSKG